MSEKTTGKTHASSVRIPVDLYDRLERLKSEQAHENVPDSKLLIEAVRLYVELAERFGLDKKLRVNEGSGKQVLRRPQSA